VRRRRWVRLPGMPTARHGLGVVALGDTVFTLMGGETPGLAFSSATEALDLGSLDAFRCFGRPPDVVGEPGPDVLAGTAAPETFVLQGGDDVVEAGGGADRVCAGGGRDEVSGQAGGDRLDGGPGRDRCPGGPGRDERRRCERGAA
jgi:Ca2+-binding RTX toxin-like protein